MSHQPHRRKRHHLRIRRRTKPGATPGTVSSTPDAAQPRVHVLAYGPGNLVEEEVHSLDRLRDVVNAHSVTWINVTGIGDAATIKHLGEIFGLHALALEDVVNVHQRPKVETYSDYLFIVVRIVVQSEHVETEQISMFLGTNLVLTFQERPGDCFDPVRERLRQASGQIRDVGADYLAYALMDAAIDSYFPIIDQFADRLDALEDSITLHADSSAIVTTIRFN